MADMADDEFKVEVELGSDEHRLTLWDRLKTLDVDDDARKRLGSRVTVTRDGKWIQLYTHTLADAREAENVVRELVRKDEVDADYAVSRWDGAAQEWVAVDGDHLQEPEETAAPDPSYVILEAYKPEFLRDLGL